jgi:signal peptidase I
MTGAEDGPSRGSAVDPADDATVESTVPPGLNAYDNEPAGHPSAAEPRSDADATQQLSAGSIPSDPDATRRLPPIDPAAGKAGAAGEAVAAGEPAGAPVAPAARPRPTWRRIAARFELPILIVVAIAIAVVLKTFVIQPFYIPSQSMEQTLHGCPGCAGDRILVFKPVYHVRDPHPGDIVVFKAPVDWDEPGGQVLSNNPVVHGIQWFGQLIGVVPPSEKDLVKRVIAIGGQTVKCCDDQGRVQISEHGADGPWRSLNEPYIYDNSRWSKPASGSIQTPDDNRSFGPVTVPTGRLWVLGDHRGDSADSRYHCGTGGSGANCDPVSSTVPISDVIGKAVAIAWPPSRWRTLGTPKTFTALALGPAGLPLEPGALGLAGAVVIGGVRRRRRR